MGRENITRVHFPRTESVYSLNIILSISHTIRHAIHANAEISRHHFSETRIFGIVKGSGTRNPGEKSNFFGTPPEPNFCYWWVRVVKTRGKSDIFCTQTRLLLPEPITTLGSLPGHRSSWQGTLINDSPWQGPWRQFRVAVFVPSPQVTEHEEYVQLDHRGFSSSEKWNFIRWKWIKSGKKFYLMYILYMYKVSKSEIWKWFLTLVHLTLSQARNANDEHLWFFLFG